MSASIFAAVEMAPRDPILGLNEASATIVDRFGVHDKPEKVEKLLAGH